MHGAHGGVAGAEQLGLLQTQISGLKGPGKAQIGCRQERRLDRRARFGLAAAPIQQQQTGSQQAAGNHQARELERSDQPQASQPEGPSAQAGGQPLLPALEAAPIKDATACAAGDET